MDVVLLLLLLLLSAFFSGSETAFFSLRQPELAALRRGSRAGARVARLVADSPRLLPALLIGNLLVNTAASVVGTAALLERLGPRGLAVAVPTLTLLLLVVGEITPKLLALRYRRSLAPLCQPALSAWLLVLRPVVAVVARGTAWLLRLLPGEGPGSRALTTDELETACELAVADGALTETEGRFLARLLAVQGLEVRQIMTPRPDVVALDAGLSRDEILEVARRAGFNRYPVMRPDRAQPVGFFHVKDLLARPAAARPLSEGLRPAFFVPESKDVAALLTELRTSRVHLAMVVDEHGDFSGIVTLDDCLRALTGPIGGETDRHDPDVFQVAPRTWVVAGRLDLRAVNEACGTALAPARDYATLGGLLMARLGRIPRVGDRVVEAGAAFEVVEMAGHAVARARVEREGPPPGEEAL